MLGQKRCFEILKSALQYGESRKPDYIEFLLVSWDNSLTRVANSQIHQNVAESEASLAVEVIHNLRIGSASTNRLTADSIEKAVDVAIESTRHKAELPSALRLDRFPTGALRALYSAATAKYAPQERAKTMQDIIARAREAGLTTSAKFQTGAGEVAVANSKGTLVYTRFTDANLSMILTGRYDSAYASIANPDVRALDFQAFTDRAIRKCALQDRPPQDLFAGKTPGDELFLDVILEPSATAEWLEFLSYCGLNGLSYLEEESFMSGRMGERVLGENVTIWDDGTDRAGYVLPFDFEGTPKRKVVFVQRGVAQNVALDGLLAGKMGKESTGHCLGAGQRHIGALPLNLFMAGDGQTVESMIASSQDPTLYVTRFHYTNIADRKNVVLTGMTKDGAFLVENGELKGPVKNLRYLQSVVDAFNHVDMLSAPSLVHDPEGYGALVPASTVAPAVRIRKVRFIGSSGT